MNYVLIILVNLALYMRTLFFGFVSDDTTVSQKKEPEPKNCLHKFWLELRGHRYFSPKTAHSITLGIHIINCCLIYWVFGSNKISLLTSLLFSMNPTNMQGGAVWVSGKGYSYATTAVLVMFGLPILAPIIYFCMPMLAPNGFFSVGAFIGTKFWWWVFLIPLFLKYHRTKEVIRHKTFDHAEKTVNTEMLAVKKEKIIPFAKSYFYYFWLSIFPHKIGLYHKFLYGFGTNKIDNQKGYKLDWSFWAGILTGLLMLAHFIYFHNIASWGLWWFCVNIAMWCNLRTIQQQISERYMYLANVGSMLFLAYTITPYPLLITAFVVGYTVRLWYTMPSYISDYWLIEYNATEFPKLHYVWIIRGVKKFAIGDLKGAFHDFCEAHVHKPYDFKACFNLASTMFMLGNLPEAKKFLEEAKKNMYDEIDKDALPLIKMLEEEMGRAELQVKEGKTGYTIELKNVTVVK